MKYVPIILSGIIVIIGFNLLLSIRDSKLYDKIEERNNQIQLLQQSS